MKTKHLVLYHPSYQRDEKGINVLPLVYGYGVATVKNTTEYTPGQWLSKAAVKDLCEISSYEVTVRARNDKDPA